MVDWIKKLQDLSHTRNLQRIDSIVLRILFQQYLLNPNRMFGIMLSTETFMDTSPHLWHSIQLVIHGVHYYKTTLSPLYVAKGLGKNFIKRYQQRITVLSLSIPLPHVHMGYAMLFYYTPSMLKKYSYMFNDGQHRPFVPFISRQLLMHYTIYTDATGPNYL